MNRVAIYVRVSTSEQVDGFSISEQTDRCKKYCEAMNYCVAKVYTDPGFSGSSIDRPAIKQLISDAENEQIDTVLVYKLDRLSRSQKDTLFLIEDVFLKHNVSFISMCENFDTGTPFGRAMIGILSVFAQLEREQINERMQMGRIGAAKEGRWRGGSGVPIGYTYTAGDKGVLKIDPYEAMQIRELYDLWNKGLSIHKICNIFREKGYTTKYGGWTYTGSVPSIITNPVYIGMQRYDGKVFPGLHEPIISEETYNNAIKELELRRSKMGENQKMAWRGKHLLSGLVYCGLCGARYFVSSTIRTNRKTHEKQVYQYYICYSRDGNKEMKKTDHCENKRWEKHALENAVMEQILKIAYDIDSIKPSPEKQKKDNTILKKIKEIDKQINKLIDLYQVGGVPFDQVGQRIKSLNDEKEKLTIANRESDTNSTLSIQDAKNILIYAADVIQNGSEEEKREIVSKLIERVTINNDHINIKWTFT